MIALLMAAALACPPSGCPIAVSPSSLFRLTTEPSSGLAFNTGDGRVTAHFCGRSVLIGHVSTRPHPELKFAWANELQSDFTFLPGLSEEDKNRAMRMLIAVASRTPMPDFCEAPQ